LLLALFVGGALAGGDFVEGAPLSLHPHVGVAREHRARDVPGDAHDHLVAGAVAPQGATVAPEKASSKKGASQKKAAFKPEKTNARLGA